VLKLDQEVRLRVEALPGEVFKGRVTFVDPVLDQMTRTARVRIEVNNKDQRLRPGMFVEASVESGKAGEGTEAPLVIPATAPLFTGRRSVVYVELADTDRPTYEARVVTLGSRMGDLYPVLAGLEEAERVVIHGAFAIDADLQIRGGDSMMNLANDEASAAENSAEKSTATSDQKREAPTKSARKSTEPNPGARTPSPSPDPVEDHSRHMQGHSH
jgi:Cu(I)/Ag(I) efflux system membrane fusion protein